LVSDFEYVRTLVLVVMLRLLFLSIGKAVSGFVEVGGKLVDEVFCRRDGAACGADGVEW
jgi:hypothetical protein